MVKSFMWRLPRWISRCHCLGDQDPKCAGVQGQSAPGGDSQHVLPVGEVHLKVVAEVAVRSSAG